MIQELDISPELLAELKQFAGVAKDQMLEVANEYLTWWFWQSVIVSASAAVAFIVLAFATRSVYKHVDWEDPVPDPVAMLGSFFLAAATVGAFCISTASAMDAIQITVAPRAYIVDMVVAKGRR